MVESTTGCLKNDPAIAGGSSANRSSKRHVRRICLPSLASLLLPSRAAPTPRGARTT